MLPRSKGQLVTVLTVTVRMHCGHPRTNESPHLRKVLQFGGCHSALGASSGLSIRSIRACLAHDKDAVPIRGFAPWLVGGCSRAGPTVGRVGFARWLRAGIIWMLARIEALFPRLGSSTSHGPWPRAWARQVSARAQAALRSSSTFFVGREVTYSQPSRGGPDVASVARPPMAPAPDPRRFVIDMDSPRPELGTAPSRARPATFRFSRCTPPTARAGFGRHRGLPGPFGGRVCGRRAGPCRRPTGRG